MHARSDILCLIDDGTSSFLLTTLQWAINHSEVTLEFLAYLRSYHKFPYTIRSNLSKSGNLENMYLMKSQLYIISNVIS